MKAPCFLLLLSCLPATGDVLSDFFPFLGASSPRYGTAGFAPREAGAEPIPFSPADPDFGVQEILHADDGPPPVHGFAFLGFNHTDRAPAATRAEEDGSWYFSGLVGAGWRPLLARGWFADLGLHQEVHRFDRGTALDFENFQTHAGLMKTLVDLDDTLFFARHEYQRLTTGGLASGDYSAQRLRAGFQKVLIPGTRRQLAAGIDIALDLDANPEQLERLEYAAELGYTWWFTGKVSATASWRGACWDFDSGGRTDWNHIAGIEFVWRFHPGASVSARVFHSRNDSNTPLGVNDFESWTAGIGIGFNLSF